MINTHIHTFTREDIAKKILPLRLFSFVTTKVGYFVTRCILTVTNPLFRSVNFNRILHMLRINKKATQEKIFNYVAKKYPDNTVFWILTINMEHMGAGRVPRPYTEQLTEIRDLYEKYPDKIKVFLHVDPRQKNFMHWVKQPFVAGIKLYPPMGYLPNDARLVDMYEYCNKKGMPIITHCGQDSPSHWKGKKSYIIQLLKSRGIKHNPRDSKKKLAGLLCHPQLFFELAGMYRHIKFILSHWGSEGSVKAHLKDPTDHYNWFLIITEGMKALSNIYTDISFTFHNKTFWKLLKNELKNILVSKKLLFGTDYYMLQSVAREKRFYEKLRKYLGEKMFKKISKENPSEIIK